MAPKPNNNKSKQLFPLFRRQPASKVVSAAAPATTHDNNNNSTKDDDDDIIIDDDDNDDNSDDDDDLPLTSLLAVRREQKSSTKEKKRRRLESLSAARSASTANNYGIENEKNDDDLLRLNSTNNNRNTSNSKNQQNKKKKIRKESTNDAIIRSNGSTHFTTAAGTSIITSTATATGNRSSAKTRHEISRNNKGLSCDTNTNTDAADDDDIVDDSDVEEMIANNNNRSTVTSSSSSPLSQQKVKNHTSRSQPRRFYSDSAMDFIAAPSAADHNNDNNNNNNNEQRISTKTQQQQSCNNRTDFIVNNINNRNIVNKLIARTTDGGHILHHRPSSSNHNYYSRSKTIDNQRPSSTSCHWPKKWKIPSWISLENNCGGGVGGKIDHMTWDAMGVLLAVATGRIISIYDWDMVRAADIQGRSDRVRNCYESEWKIPPIVQFQIPSLVGSLVWNLYNMDELAVGFRVSGQMRIYNVDRVARWLSKDPSRNNRCTPPPSTYQNMSLQRITGSVCDILFLDADNVLVSVGNFLYRWKLLLSNEKRQKQQRTSSSSTTTGGTLIWRYQPPSNVTSMAPLGSNLVVVGTNRGHLCLLDWTKRTKERSFSNEHRPLVLQNWIPHDRLDGPKEDKSLRMMMGIMKLRIETSNNECVAGKNYWGRCRVTWVTHCGWLLSVIMESAKIQENCLVHHSSPKVVFRNADGSLINTDDKRSWSLPYHPIGVDISSRVACWVNVPTVTKVLAHHDKFVLDSQPNTIVSKRRALMVHTFDQEIHSIQLPKAVKDLPQSLVIHPNLEWILVGEGGKIHILVGRDLKGISSSPTNRISPQLS
jgi:hypothetical protein